MAVVLLVGFFDFFCFSPISKKKGLRALATKLKEAKLTFDAAFAQWNADIICFQVRFQAVLVLYVAASDCSRLIRRPN
jgi:hypothetical protein